MSRSTITNQFQAAAIKLSPLLSEDADPQRPMQGLRHHLRVGGGGSSFS